MTNDLVTLDWQGDAAVITLNRPDRHNSLVPGLFDDLQDCLRRAVENPHLDAVILAAHGRSFSTGGDVRAFYDQGDAIGAYGEKLVGQLNDIVLALKDLPVPLIGRVQGPVTGGSVGLLLACDFVATTPQFFLQPWYSVVGFAPDGGWTAILPDYLGKKRVADILMRNLRLKASDLVECGIVTAIVDADGLDDCIQGWLDDLRVKVPHGLSVSKEALWQTTERDRVAAALETERRLFVERVVLPETRQGMARFLGIDQAATGE